MSMFSVGVLAIPVAVGLGLSIATVLIKGLLRLVG